LDSALKHEMWLNYNPNALKAQVCKFMQSMFLAAPYIKKKIFMNEFMLDDTEYKQLQNLLIVSDR